MYILPLPPMPDPRIAQFSEATSKSIDHLKSEYSKLQTGRASAAIVEHVHVDAYGQKQELRAVAGISIEDAKTIVVQPWDKGIMNQVEAALSELDLGTAPNSDGVVIRIVLPPMTEERRKDMTKIVHQLAEEARISVRQQRDKVRDEVKEEKDEDLRYTLLEELDTEAGKANDDIESHMKAKEEEVMTV